MKKQILILTILFTLGQANLFAQDFDDFLELDIDELLNMKVVVTASKQAEPLRETPVPITIITDEMIEHSGALNLKDLLITYVPGMTFSQDHNEINVSARGIYGSSQQKMLVLQDGHRLNCRAYSEANPDFSISLDKIKQIEILRGPGSSLYGNVALTAVINIITKKGSEIDGTQINIGGGNYGQRKFSLLFGKNWNDEHDLVLWGTLYKADGQKIDVPLEQDYSAEPSSEAEAILGGIKDLPAYDVGLKLCFGNITLFGAMRYCHYIEPFTAGGKTGESYNYDDYRIMYGTGPGLGSRFAHLGLIYNRSLKEDLELQWRGSFDTNSIEVNLVANPATMAFGRPSWDEYSFGSTLQLVKLYDLGGMGSGNIIVGAQYDKMRLMDSQFPFGTGGDWTVFNDTEENRLLQIGTEIIYSGFAQVKHRFNNKLIANIGLRFDNKDRHKGDNESDMGPRMALIYLPNSSFELKFSFAQSFVDAPYWYRYNSLGSYRGGEDLKPEHLTSYQITPAFHILDGKMSNRFNFFYNDLTDFIWRNNNAAADEPIYQNAGGMTSWGIENEFSYLQKNHKIYAT